MSTIQKVGWRLVISFALAGLIILVTSKVAFYSEFLPAGTYRYTYFLSTGHSWRFSGHTGHGAASDRRNPIGSNGSARSTLLVRRPASAAPDRPRRLLHHQSRDR